MESEACVLHVAERAPQLFKYIQQVEDHGAGSPLSLECLSAIPSATPGVRDALYK